MSRKSLICLLAGLTLHIWSWTRSSFVGEEVDILLRVDNQSLVEQQYVRHCWNWLADLKQPHCHLVRVILLGLISLPLYNGVLILVGWSLNRSASARAERLLLDRCLEKPIKRREAPAPPTLPPKPPPRCRRRPAPKPPSQSQHPSEVFPNHKNPFASTLQRSRDQAQQYNTLRRNLRLVLDGLQQPLPPPSDSPFVICPSESQQQAFVTPLLQLPPNKTKIKSKPKLLRALISRFRKNKPVTMNESINSSSSRSGISHFWQLFKSRSNCKPILPESSSSASSSISSASSCFYT